MRRSVEQRIEEALEKGFKEGYKEGLKDASDYTFLESRFQVGPLPKYTFSAHAAPSAKPEPSSSSANRAEGRQG